MNASCIFFFFNIGSRPIFLKWRYLNIYQSCYSATETMIKVHNRHRMGTRISSSLSRDWRQKANASSGNRTRDPALRDGASSGSSGHKRARVWFPQGAGHFLFSILSLNQLCCTTERDLIMDPPLRLTWTGAYLSKFNPTNKIILHAYYINI